MVKLWVYSIKDLCNELWKWLFVIVLWTHKSKIIKVSLSFLPRGKMRYLFSFDGMGKKMKESTQQLRNFVMRQFSNSPLNFAPINNTIFKFFCLMENSQPIKQNKIILILPNLQQCYDCNLLHYSKLIYSFKSEEDFSVIYHSNI